jgi:hypothetical protein
VTWDHVLFDRSSPEICEFLRVDILMCSSFEASFTSYWRGSCRLSICMTATWRKAWWYNESFVGGGACGGAWSKTVWLNVSWSEFFQSCHIGRRKCDISRRVFACSAAVLLAGSVFRTSSGARRHRAALDYLASQLLSPPFGKFGACFLAL